MQQTSSLSHLVQKTLAGLSPIQTIMKMAEAENIKALGLKPEEIISFGGGWCNHAAPEEYQQIYQEIVGDTTLFHESGRYSSIIGHLHCREQLSRFEQKLFGVRDLTADHILLGQSSTQLFHDILRVLCNPGEPVGFLDPTYANYVNGLKCALPGSDMCFISGLNKDTWEYMPDPERSIEQLKEFCSRGLKVLVFPTPDNPTSQQPHDDFIQASYEILEDNRGYLVLDLPYKCLWFEKKPQCFSWSPVDHPHLITLHSNSKWLSSLGRRFGWIEAAHPVIHGFEKISESMILSPDTLHSMATSELLERTLDTGILEQYIEEVRILYQHTSRVTINALDKYLGWPRLEPQGGLYTVCPTPEQSEPVSFAQNILKNTGVLLIPGKGFGPSMELGLRISYGPLCYNHDKINEGFEKIGAYLS